MEFVLTPTAPEIQSNTVKCIARVAQSCKHRERQGIKLYINQIIGLLGNILHFSYSCMCFLSMLSCLLVCLADNRKLLHEQDVEKVLVELLSVVNDSVKTATCHAVAAMSFHLASKDSFRDLGTYAFIQQPKTATHLQL